MNKSWQFHPLVWVILGGTVFTRIASFMAMPFLAVYLYNSQNAHPVLIGVAIGVAPLVGTIGGFVGGYLTDRFGRKLIIITTIFIWSIVFLGFGIAEQILVFIVLNALNGLCRSFFEPSTQALMIDYTPSEQRKRLFSLRYAAINIAGVIGPLLGSYIALKSAQSVPFIITGVMYLIYALFLLSILNRYEMKQMKLQSQMSITTILNTLLHNRALLFFIAGGTIVNLGYSQIDSTLPQYLQMTFEDGVKLFSIIIALNAFIVIALQIPLSLLSEKWPIMRTIQVGVLFYAAGYLLFAFADSVLGLYLAITILTIGEILVFPSTSVVIDQIAPRDQKAIYLGAAQFKNMGSFVGPIAGGWILASISGQVLFLTISILTAGSIVLYMLGDRGSGSISQQS